MESTSNNNETPQAGITASKYQLAISALEAIVNPIDHMKAQLKKDEWLNGLYTIKVAERPEFYQDIARRALSEIAAEGSLKDLCKRIMGLNHMGVQSNHIHYCEQMHETILELDKLSKHEAVRLLMHVIHVQQLQLEGARLEYDPQNPFRDMVNFTHIDEYVKHFSPKMDTLY
jgi:hypothetical protein